MTMHRWAVGAISIFAVGACGGTVTGKSGSAVEGSGGGSGNHSIPIDYDGGVGPVGTGGITIASGGSGPGGTTTIANGGSGPGGTPAYGGGGSTGCSMDPFPFPVEPVAPPAAVDAGTCHAGPLYVESTGLAGAPNSIPVECEMPISDRPEWVNSNICEYLRTESNVPTCVDGLWGLGSCGELMQPRCGAGSCSADLFPVLSNASPLNAQLSCPGASSVHCHRGGYVGVSSDCGDAPVGTGGTIVPGAYVLTEYVRFAGGTSYPTPGAHIQQTLYMTGESALLISDDDNNFILDGTYRYLARGNAIGFAVFCETQPAQYRAFPTTATFTATGTTLELYDATRKVRQKFRLLQ